MVECFGESEGLFDLSSRGGRDVDLVRMNRFAGQDVGQIEVVASG